MAAGLGQWPVTGGEIKLKRCNVGGLKRKDQWCTSIPTPREELKPRQLDNINGHDFMVQD